MDLKWSYERSYCSISHTVYTGCFCVLFCCDYMIILSDLCHSFILDSSALLNLAWPIDAMWHHRILSKLVQVMACCLMATSHYLKQCWLIVTSGFPLQRASKPERASMSWHHHGFSICGLSVYDNESRQLLDGIMAHYAAHISFYLPTS